MIYNEQENEYTLSTGTVVAANNGIFGLGPDGCLTDGYDSTIEWEGGPKVFTPEERHEIGLAMVALWHTWMCRKCV